MRSKDASSVGNEIQSSDSHRNSTAHNIPEHTMVMKLAQGLTNPNLPLVCLLKRLLIVLTFYIP